VAVDGTGLSPHGVSTYFVRRMERQSGGKTRYRHFLKWLVVADVDRQILLAQRARQGPRCDAPALPGLLEVASRTMPIGLVLADAEFDSEANHQHIRITLGAHSVIPARRRGVPNGEIRNQMYRAFPRKLNGPRAKRETVFSVVKRKLSAKAPGRSLLGQVRQALLLGLTFNLHRLRHRPLQADVNRAIKALCLPHIFKIIDSRSILERPTCSLPSLFRYPITPLSLACPSVLTPAAHCTLLVSGARFFLGPWAQGFRVCTCKP